MTTSPPEPNTKPPLRELLQRVNPLVNFSVSRYVFSIGIFIGVLIFGLIAMRGLGVDLLPNITIPVVNVSTTYTGASPESMDTQVTQVLESALSQVSGVSGMSSTSGQGSSRVTLNFNQGVDLNAAVNQVASAAASAARRLPTGISTPIVRTFNPNAQPILELGLSGGKASMNDVYDYANNVLVPQLQELSGVANVTVTGGSTRQIQVLLNPSKMASYGLTPAAVSNAISNANVNSSIGTITRDQTSLTYTTNTSLTSLAALANVPIDAARGIQLSDVASIWNNAATNGYTRVGGVPVVLLSVQQSAGSNAVAVADQVQGLLKNVKLPGGYAYTVSNDTTLPIRAALSATTRELWITALVVAVVTMLFLGRLNTSLTVIAAIPIALSAAPILYSLMGFTFNQVSLLAMIVAIGIVVDDSIVVAENVERYRALGLDRMQAVLKGASEVFSAVAAASLSLLAVLIPVSFLGGIVGQYIQQFALGLAAAVAMSWLEALLFLTVRMAYTPDAHPLTWKDVPGTLAALPRWMKWGASTVRQWWFWAAVIVLAVAVVSRLHRPAFLAALVLLPVALGLLAWLWGVLLAVLEALTSTLSGWTNALLVRVREAYARTLDEALDFSPIVLLFSVGFLVLTGLFVAPHLNFTFTPSTDSGSLQANLRLPSNLSLATTNQLVSRMENYFLHQPSVKTVQSTVTNTNASLVLTLKPIGQRPGLATLTPQFQQTLRNMYPDFPSVRANIFSQGGFRGQGTQQTLTLISSNFDLLKDRATAAVDAVQNNANILSVQSDMNNLTLENRFVPTSALLAGTGLTVNDVAQTLNGYATGLTPANGNMTLNGVTYPIQVMANPSAVQDEQSLLALPVYSSTSQSNLTVGQLGTITRDSLPQSITRNNRIYSLTLTYQPTTESKLSTADLQNDVISNLTSAGVLDTKVSVGPPDSNGIAALGNSLSGLGVQAFALSLLLVYLVMGSQFNSFRYPMYLLLPVPFAVAGALWAIFITGSSLDIFGVLGFLLLIGLSAKNAIIYLEFVVEKMQELPFREAMVEASRLRFRPIVMTTLTVMVVSLPLLLNKGSGSEFGKSISIVMVGGITVSALMTFFVVPAAFYLGERRRAQLPKRAPSVAEPQAVSALPAPSGD